jgi:hypothetical protein
MSPTAGKEGTMQKDISALIIVPECSGDELSDGLRALTEHLHKVGADISGGLLGGEFGYGAYYENETFMMHPFCWCDSDECPWCGDEQRANFIFKPTGAMVGWYKYIGRDNEISGSLPENWLSVCIASTERGHDAE